jgi:hypothetical protein
MVITRQYASKNNIKLYDGLQFIKKNKYKNDKVHYVFQFLLLIIFFTTLTITYYYLFKNDNTSTLVNTITGTSFYNFIITDLPEKTIINLYNKIPARPYNYFLDLIQDYNIDYF